MAGSVVDLTTSVGSVSLPNPVMTASGTAGHGAELRRYFDLSSIGAVVVKSLSPFEWAGNRAPRVHGTPAGMINSVGLQNPGVERWRADELPALVETGARVVASIWGRSVDDYARAAEMLAGSPGVVAVEVNVSCPNLEARGEMFAHDPDTTEAVMSATGGCGLPRWAKLSPNVTDLAAIAAGALAGGAEALTISNTLLGMVIDTDTLHPVLGAGGGGLSGAAVRPVAVRNVYDLHVRFPDTPIIGVGGVTRGCDAVEFLAAGASAIQVGTATFSDPRASTLVRDELSEWCRHHRTRSITSIIGAAHVNDC